MDDKKFWNGKRVFVTGHTGFKGSWLCLWLHALGAEVFGYALDPPSDPSLFDTACVEQLMSSVIGWRAMNHSGPKGPGTTPPSPGIKFFTPLDETGSKWRETVVSGDEVAVEDIRAADLNGDGRADIVAAARQTKNLKIFFSKP